MWLFDFFVLFTFYIRETNNYELPKILCASQVKLSSEGRSVSMDDAYWSVQQNIMVGLAFVTCSMHYIYNTVFIYLLIRCFCVQSKSGKFRDHTKMKWQVLLKGFVHDLNETLTLVEFYNIWIDCPRVDILDTQGNTLKCK
jgi:hypothetical protein